MSIEIITSKIKELEKHIFAYDDYDEYFELLNGKDLLYKIKMKDLSDKSTEARMIRLQSALEYRYGALGTRIIKKLGDYYHYFKYINDEDDNCILKKCFKEVKYIKPTP